MLIIVIIFSARPLAAWAAPAQVRGTSQAARRQKTRRFCRRAASALAGFPPKILQ